jgi:hypothetical protein
MLLLMREREREIFFLFIQSIREGKKTQIVPIYAYRLDAKIA